MSIGKRKRMKQIFRNSSSRSIILPLDHGLTIGPIDGILNIKDTLDDFSQAPIDAFVLHKGIVMKNIRSDVFADKGLIIQLSASSSFQTGVNTKTLVCTVEEAIRLGADAVTIQVNLGDANETQMLFDAGKIAEQCESYGMPLLMMMYARGMKISHPSDPEVVAHCARIARELGADMVKVAYTGDVESFADVVEGCNIPVFIAGGETIYSSLELFTMIKESLEAGASGLAIGRNVFQHPKRIELCHALKELVHDNRSINEVLQKYSLD